ncbi:DUF2125 domain-containing protein [Bartonella machadoae]|uniref:DUF2125 domain-containing protein n=1 Tax=Bartonella machadoae TaxID=2893471 RepID=UPI001F4CB726|nr:DUF2125 domain-containing protein [Bartonella machadoae]UNE54141.1 DUF2125 domain-containing protein [Bartonella machadoae]
MVFFSRKIEDRVSDLLARASARDITIVCKHLSKNGYPLRIGVSCDQFQFSWPLHKLSLSTARLMVGAPIYTSRFVEFHVSSPASLVFSGKMPIALQWRNLMIETEPYWKTAKTFKLMAEGLEVSTIASSFKDQKFPEKFGSQTKNKKEAQENIRDKAFLKDAVDVIAPSLDQENRSQKITAEFLRLDLKNEKNHLSGHLIVDDFDSSLFFAPYFVDFPKIDGNLKWTFNDVSHSFENGANSWKQYLYGKSGVLKRGELVFHTGGLLRISGPFSFDDEGYLTAKFDLVFVKHMELLTTLQRLFPEQANNLQALFFVLSVMPKSPDGYPILPLKITHGWAKLGFLKLGRLAPL